RTSGIGFPSGGRRHGSSTTGGSMLSGGSGSGLPIGGCRNGFATMGGSGIGFPIGGRENGFFNTGGCRNGFPIGCGIGFPIGPCGSLLTTTPGGNAKSLTGWFANGFNE